MDNDCSATCGDGILDENETCDGNCPTSCPTNNVCSIGTLQGSAGNCNLTCNYSTISRCKNDDGCCPAGCNSSNDNDCSVSCGNSVVEPGETCDGNCPTQCNDNNACTTNSLLGSAAACTARCQFTPITVCQSGDGCCPSGCSFANDTDCPCTALTCQPGQCGSLPNGCGGTLNCGGCSGGQTCSANQCVTQQTLLPAGSACTSGSQCAGIINPFCSNNPNYHNGYCSSECQFDNDCYSGSHCAQKDTQTGIGSCVKNCNSTSDCRTNYDCILSGATQTSKACLPSGVGNGIVGDACSGVFQCSGGSTAMCISSWPGGSCSLDCTSLSLFGLDTCPTGSRCYATALFGADGVCAKSCSPGSCRSGYTCRTQTPIFGGESFNVCVP